MKPGEVIEIVGKVTVKASFGTITYGPAKGKPRGTTTARALVVPNDLHGNELLKWIHSLEKKP